MSHIIGFEPIADKNATVLILGSMPGEVSLNKNQYYAHPQNKFWYIMSHVLGFDINASYTEKQKAFRKSGVALWDVMKSCNRKGSLDSSIDNSTVVANDFECFLSRHKKIRYVFFNGAKAEKEFKKHVMPKISETHFLEYHRLPSTSPAMAMLSQEAKLAEWKIITGKIQGQD